MRTAVAKSSNKRLSGHSTSPLGIFSSSGDHGNAFPVSYENTREKCGADACSPVSVTGFVMKAEYRILDITTEMIELSKVYDLRRNFSNIPEESNNEEDNESRTIEFLSLPTVPFVNSAGKINSEGGLNGKGLQLKIDTQLLNNNDAIKDNIYNCLSKIYDLANDVHELDQYVLRELRYLQEYLTHGYPDIATFIKIPLEEVITSVRGRTKGFKNDHQEPSPTPMDNRTSPPLSPPGKENKTDDASDDEKKPVKKKISTTEKVKKAVQKSAKNETFNHRDISIDVDCYGKPQEAYGFFIEVGNEGDEGLFFD